MNYPDTNLIDQSRGASGPLRGGLDDPHPPLPLPAPLVRAVFALSLAAAAIIASLSWMARNFQVADALIYYRYVRNALEGQGLVYNPGERFNALTSPLHTLLFLLLAWIVGDVPAAATLLSALAMIGGACVWTALVARNVSLPAAIPGMLIYCASVFFYLTYGLETTLFVFVLGLSILLFQSGRTWSLGIALAATVLTRGEGFVLIPALAIEHFRRRRPFPPLPPMLLGAALVLAVLAFNGAYYGSPLPSSFAAKLAQGHLPSGHDAPPFLRMQYLLDGYIPGDPVWRGVMTGLILLAGFRLRASPLNVILGAFLAAYVGFYLLLGLPNYHWYNGPFFVVGFFYAGIGLEQAWSRVRSRFQGRRQIFGSGLIALLAVFLISTAALDTVRTLRDSSPPPHYRNIGLWIRDNTPPDARLAAVEIGALGYYSRRPIIDIMGLTNPHNAGFVARGDFEGWLNHHSPDYMLVHQPRWPHEQAIRRLLDSGRARLVKRFPGFRLYAIVDPAENAPSRSRPPG